MAGSERFQNLYSMSVPSKSLELWFVSLTWRLDTSLEVGLYWAESFVQLAQANAYLFIPVSNFPQYN